MGRITISLADAMILVDEGGFSGRHGISKEEQRRILEKYGIDPDKLELLRKMIPKGRIVGRKREDVRV
ncbi:MAG TPA: hypothetical protein ENG09_00125 [Candidatus Syntrophoarchaeum butanivorans]|uniref:Uncharacterized protein n=1 Tax=Candidatus Syntropharchaeum butanivorans TaxID=1839936 RepID=A0A7C0X391_9EURY|nr:hypothetical protein [Candidatus Syntrophoarchaeum butanivorans]